MAGKAGFNNPLTALKNQSKNQFFNRGLAFQGEGGIDRNDRSQGQCDMTALLGGGMGFQGGAQGFHGNGFGIQGGAYGAQGFQNGGQGLQNMGRSTGLRGRGNPAPLASNNGQGLAPMTEDPLSVMNETGYATEATGTSLEEIADYVMNDPVAFQGDIGMRELWAHRIMDNDEVWRHLSNFLISSLSTWKAVAKGQQ